MCRCDNPRAWTQCSPGCGAPDLPERTLTDAQEAEMRRRVASGRCPFRANACGWAECVKHRVAS